MRKVFYLCGLVQAVVTCSELRNEQHVAHPPVCCCVSAVRNNVHLHACVFIFNGSSCLQVGVTFWERLHLDDKAHLSCRRDVFLLVTVAHMMLTWASLSLDCSVVMSVLCHQVWLVSSSHLKNREEKICLKQKISNREISYTYSTCRVTAPTCENWGKNNNTAYI